MTDLEKWKEFLDSKGYEYEIREHNDYDSLKICRSCYFVDNTLYIFPNTNGIDKAFYVFFNKSGSVKNL